MTSSYTTRNRFNKQATGDNTNTWGDVLSAGVVDLADFAMDGRVALTITGNVTLTSANGTTDQARGRTLDLTGSVGATITVPALEKWYLVANGSSADQVIASSGGGSTVTVRAGELVPVYCDAANVKRLTLLSMESHRLQNMTDPVNPQDGATKQYADNLAFTANAGILPAQTGNAGKVLFTNGSVASWVNSLGGGALTFDLSSVTLTGAALTGGVTFTGSTKQNVNAVGAANIDWSVAEFHTKSISTNTTFTFSNITASKAQAVVLLLTISSAAVPTWPAAVKWTAGTAPGLGNGTHMLGFVTFDGGTTVYGQVGIQAAA